MEEDTRLITPRGVFRDVSNEIRYQVGVFEVTFTETEDDSLHPFENVNCECEVYTKNQSNVRLKTSDQKKCRHIREAEMYRHFEKKVTPVEKQ